MLAHAHKEAEMLITRDAELTELAKYMGDGATEGDASLFLEALLEAGFEGEDSVEIPHQAWKRLMAEALPVWLP
jgi:hypothetical protein